MLNSRVSYWRHFIFLQVLLPPIEKASLVMKIKTVFHGVALSPESPRLVSCSDRAIPVQMFLDFTSENLFKQFFWFSEAGLTQALAHDQHGDLLVSVGPTRHPVTPQGQGGSMPKEIKINDDIGRIYYGNMKFQNRSLCDLTYRSLSDNEKKRT